MTDSITVRKASADDMPELLAIRREMLAAVNDVPESGISDGIMRLSEEYFRSGDQLTVLAYRGTELAGCATICWLSVMPTYSHPTGKRAHIMNVYTRPAFRREGAARRMLDVLLNEARERGATSVTLDATESGRLLYEKLGFRRSEEHMELELTNI